MRVVVAPDKFAGTMTAAEAAAAMARGWQRARPDDELTLLPVADGGEGLLEVVAASVQCQVVDITVTGPLGQPVQGRWLRLADGRAILEAAAACGLRHVPPAHRNPLRTTSRGVGELLLAAADCTQIIVGLGGSATVDGGAGMAAALGARLLDAAGSVLPAAVPSLADLASVEAATAMLPPVLAAVDVDNPLLGATGAAPVFGPQKGADPDDVRTLEAALRSFADTVERDLAGGPWRDLPGAGAAGGIGFALAAFAGASLTPGAAVVAELLGLDDAVASADLVLTGEGSLDAQTLHGKAPDHVRRTARAYGAQVMAVAGHAEPSAAAAFDAVGTLGPDGMRRPVALTEEAAYELALQWQPPP